MIVAVIAVLMMQTPVDDVVDMIAVRNRLVSATRPVHMAALAAGGDALLAAIGIRLANLEHVLVVVDLPVHLVRMVQMAVVQIVNVLAVTDGLVAAIGAVGMIVIGMGLAGL